MPGHSARVDPVEIIAGRLHLRPWEERDVDVVLRAGTDPGVQRWTQVPVPYTRAHAEDVVGRDVPEQWTAEGELVWAVCEATTGAPLASVGLHPPRPEPLGVRLAGGSGTARSATGGGPRGCPPTGRSGRRRRFRRQGWCRSATCSCWWVTERAPERWAGGHGVPLALVAPDGSIAGSLQLHLEGRRAGIAERARGSRRPGERRVAGTGRPARFEREGLARSAVPSTPRSDSVVLSRTSP